MPHGDIQEQLKRAAEVQARYADFLMSKPHVVGVGIGFAHKEGMETPQVALVVMVNEKIPAAQLAPEDMVPSELDGVRVDVQPTGGFTAFNAQAETPGED